MPPHQTDIQPRDDQLDHTTPETTQADLGKVPPPSYTPPKAYKGPFGWLYRMKDWVEGFAAKRHAKTALFLIAAAESIFFPIPVDALLIALCVSYPLRSYAFALICTLGSLAGAGVGYALGFFLWYEVTAAGPQFSAFAQFFFNNIPGFTTAVFERVGQMYRDYDFWAIFIAGFTPLPYKVFTISAGVFQLNLPMFFLASAISRAARFFLVASLFYFFGVPIKAFIDKYLGWLTILFVVLLAGGFVLLRYLV